MKVLGFSVVRPHRFMECAVLCRVGPVSVWLSDWLSLVLLDRVQNVLVVIFAMSFELLIILESFITQGTFYWLIITVYFHMTFQVPGISIYVITSWFRALLWWSCMSSRMRCQVRFPLKVSVTSRIHAKPLFSHDVFSLVTFHVALKCSSFTTSFTFI